MDQAHGQTGCKQSRNHQWSCSGIIVSLLGQAYSAKDAACLAVFLHGKAGDEAARKLGKEGLLASDIARELRFFT